MICHPQCAGCRHFNPADYSGNYCAAYSDGAGIPWPILRNEHDHREPYEGDRGVRFEEGEPE
ncbi:MAG: hypothetical protein ABIL09_16140 [Gemmatimonadota bacterium]